MKRLMISAMQSGAGKTVTTCALLAALRNRGKKVCSFKCGPDYIDPMFHTEVLGIPSRNLDLFLQGTDGVLRTLCRAEGEIAVLEGAMGYYDGMAGTEKGSAWEIGEITKTPVVLVLRPKGVGPTLAAQVRGLIDFRPDSRIAGLLLADCKPSLAAYLTPVLEREAGLPVFGFLPPMEEARLESRHLGLMTASEIDDLGERFSVLAEKLEETADLDRLLSVAADQPLPEETLCPRRETHRCRIAVARDEAFCFYYEDNLDLLREAGAELVYFSPLRDVRLPEADGVYLGGGYPELYARALSENSSMRQDVKDKLRGGLPAVAECGGFLYLQESLENDAGERWEMCGVLSGRGVKTDSLQRFGYGWLCAERDSLLFRLGERVPVHEFHYWDSTENGNSFLAEKPNGRQWRCGYGGDTLYAAFPHLHFGGEIPLAERFCEACERKSYGA